MYTSLLLIFLSIAIAVGGQLCLKMGMDKIGKITNLSLGSLPVFFKNIATSPVVLLGLFLYATSALVWLVVLSRVDLSFAYPMVGLSYVLVLILSALLLKEQVSLVRWSGALVILGGVFLISRT